MQNELLKRVKELAGQVSTEQDPVRFPALLAELTYLLNSQEETPYDLRSDPKPPEGSQADSC